MNTKALAMSIAFAVVAMVLNPAVTGIKIPSPFLTGLYYQVWDIPIMIAFLLLGFKYGVFAGVLNSVFLFAVFPGPSQPFYAPSNVVAQFSMMIGIFFAIKLFIIREPKPENCLKNQINCDFNSSWNNSSASNYAGYYVRYSPLLHGPHSISCFCTSFCSTNLHYSNFGVYYSCCFCCSKGN